jgi:hypothetical protein
MIWTTYQYVSGQGKPLRGRFRALPVGLAKSLPPGFHHRAVVEYRVLQLFI